MLILLPPVNAEAFWWLFAKNENQVNMSYLFINDISYDESGQDITLYRDFLEDGLIDIRGRAVINKGQIGSVLISVDGKKNWENAKLSDDGAFQYYFKPEIGRTYEIYIEAMETGGRTNDADETLKTVTVSDKSYRDVIDERLSQIFAAYMERDSNRFMDYVSWDFVGGDLVLEQAINKDFSNFADIDINYNLVNLALNNEGMFNAVLEFDRRVISFGDGQTLTDSGITEFVFNLEEDGPMLYSMNHPLIFGISDAANVASGVINSAENDQIISVDDQGNIELKPVEDIIEDDYDDDDSGDDDDDDDYTYESGEKYIYGGSSYSSLGYRFSDGAFIDGQPYQPDPTVDFFMETNIIFVSEDVRVIKLNETDINNVTEVPASGYVTEWELPENCTIPEQCYALLLPDGNYAVLLYEETEFISEEDSLFRIKFYYKYRDDGGRQF